MKIIKQLTIRYLKENKKRTILTILCIAVSVIMISCVGIAFYSGKQYYKDYIVQVDGDYHYAFVSHGQDVINYIHQDKQIDYYYLSSTTSYYYQKEDSYRESLYIKRGDQEYFKKKDMFQYLKSGKLPTNSHEIAISQNYLNNNHLDKKLGDSLTLKDNENNKDETFTIVGFINEYQSKSYMNTSFNAISYINIENSDAYYTVYAIDKDVSTNIFDHGKQIQDNVKELKNNKDENINFRYNSSYLAIQDIFEKDSQSLFIEIYNMIAIILVIIILLSVFIIYQAFNLSTNDRIQYLGMLSSVGATPKQKKRSVYFEGLILSLISIPLGLLISFIGLWITFSFINQLEFLKEMNVQIHTQISFLYLAIVIVLSLLTIFISLYLPARRISKISVIDALKKNDEVKVKSKKLKSGLMTRRFFNLTQQMAIKNYKRQGRRSQVIVFSLVVSMIAFISIYSFGVNMMKQSERAKQYNDYDVSINANSSQIHELNQFLNKNDKVNDYYYDTSILMKAKLDPSYFLFDLNETMLSYNENNEFYVDISAISLNEYKEICKENNIDYQENQALLYNGLLDKNDGSISKQRYSHMNKNFVKNINFEEYVDEYKIKKKSMSLFDSIQTIDTEKYIFSSSNSLTFIVPETYMMNLDNSIPVSFEYKVHASKHKELTKELTENNYSAFDYAATVENDKEFFLIVQVFIYGFVCIMILFSILNIINMMSASIDNRKKEFGMMMSVGMSNKGIQKMIFYESFIYGLKTLIYALPICIFIEWLLYNQIYIENYHFRISYLSYLISFVVIMIVMLVTFRVGLNKFKKQNIIETLKDDM